MKIWRNIPGVPGIYGKNRSMNKIRETSEIKQGKDVLSISDKAKDYQVAIKYLKEVPDIREDKVKKMANKLQSGNYDIKGNKIAEKIIQSVFDKKV